MGDTPIELGLFKPEAAASAGASRLLLPVVAELLDVLADATLDIESLGTAEFRKALDLYTRRMEAAADDKTLLKAAADCTRHCYDFHRKHQAHLGEREAEFADLLRVVEQLVGTVGGESARLDEQLAGSSARLSTIVEIDDLRVLKRRLSLELATLRNTIADQQRHHDAQRRVLSIEVERLQRRLVQVREEASLDGLTRVPNRARFDRALRRWTALHKRSGQTFVLAIVDVDHFKQINDNCGHPGGDQVLCRVADTLREAVRASDVVARYGGDEFALLLSGVDAQHGIGRVTQMLETIARLHVAATLGDGGPMYVSATAGLSEWSVQDGPADLVARADRALYQAKAQKRGTVLSVLRPPKSKLFENGRPVAGVRKAG